MKHRVYLKFDTNPTNEQDDADKKQHGASDTEDFHEHYVVLRILNICWTIRFLWKIGLVCPDKKADAAKKQAKDK